jgi:protein MpaA
MDLIEKYQPKKIITVHSPYKVLNFDGPARALADAMALASGYPVVEDIGYPTPGSFGTYAGKIRQIPVVTLELPPNPDEEGGETLEQVWQDNWASLEAAVQF